MHYRRKAILNHFSQGEKFRVRSGLNKLCLVVGMLLSSLPAINVIIENNTFADALSATIDVKSFRLSKNGTEITSFDEAHASSDVADYTSKMTHNMPTDLEIVVDVSINGRAINAGDTVLIPVQTHSADIPDVASDYDLLIDRFNEAPLYSAGAMIGTFDRTSDGILLTFNQTASGLSSIEGLTLSMNNAARSAALGYDRIGYITIAGEKFYVGIGKVILNALQDRTYTGEVTNNTVLWETRSGAALTNALSSGRGQLSHDLTPTKTIVEQNYPGAIDHYSLNIRNARRIPQSLAGNSEASIRMGSTKTYTSDFTEIVQASGESYDTFKSRVVQAPLQYGFYKDADGIRFIINYGVLGVDTPFDSAEEWAEQSADNAIAQGFYAAADRTNLINYYLDCYGENSALAQSPSVYYNFRMVYPVAYEDTQVTSSVVMHYGDSDQVTDSATATLVGIFGEADVPAGAVQLITIDADDYSLINGGVYKLQLKRGTELDKYEDYNPSDGGSVYRTVTENGTLTFSRIRAGIYRLVEVSVPDGYDPTLSNGYDEADEVAYSENFEISDNDTEGIRIVMRNTKAEPEPGPEPEPEPTPTPTPEPDDKGDKTPTVPDTGAVRSADQNGSEFDAGIYVLSATGLAMIALVILNKKSSRR